MVTTTQIADRNDERQQIHKQIDLRIVVHRSSQSGETEEINAVPLDISYNGIKLSTSRSLAYTDLVVLHLESSELDIDFSIEATVRWIRQGDDPSTWLIGCSFANHLTDEYVDAIANAGCVDRRQVPRCETKIKAFVRLAGKRSSYPITLLDYSASGIRFASRESIDPNQPIKLVLTDSDGELLQVGAKSQWNMSYESGFLIGCEIGGKHRNLFDTWLQGLRNVKTPLVISQWQLGVYSCLFLLSLLILFWRLAN